MKKIGSRLPRLDPSSYIGYKHVAFTANCTYRKKLFVKRKHVDISFQLLKDNLQKFGCECLVYIFMPDHVHMILHGVSEKSSILECHNNWKGESGKELAEIVKGTKLETRFPNNATKVWQPQSYDHVLRSYEYEKRVLQKMISYILQNPVRAGIVKTWQEYPFLGSTIGKYDIRHPYWWD